MKRRCIQGWLLICLLLQLSGCIGEERYNNDPEGNFWQLWTIIDEQYCFLDYKHIDWKRIGRETLGRITPQMSDEDLFWELSGMVNQLKDGHVNLTSSFGQSSYDIASSALRNFEEYLIEQERYLGNNFHADANIKYKIIGGNIGYIYYESFQNNVNEQELDQLFTHLANCKGLIFDVRQNSGGSATNSTHIASRFIDSPILTGYICHKTGTGHSDFSKPHPIYLKPSKGIRWNKPVVVLTNRYVYSAGNEFVNQMKGLPRVTIIGDATGGGAGLPFCSELPNGWTIRFSASPHFDDQMNAIEWGIDPDQRIDLKNKDTEKGIDTLIETARRLLQS